MGRGTDSGRPPRKRVDDAAKACFLKALRAGLKREAAAKEAGFTTTAFYYARERDPVFALAYAWALDLSAADGRAERGVRAPLHPAPDAGDIVIAPNCNRLLQKRHVRRPRFDDRRKRLFLDHFAGTADANAACAAAGIAYSTYTQHRRKDPEFAIGCEEALVIGYAAMEAEVVRERLEAQRNFRDGISPIDGAPAEFERTMRVLARYQRHGGTIGLREVGPGAMRRGDFMDGIAWLDDRLRGLGIRWNVVADPIQLPGPGPDSPAGDSQG